MRIIAAGAAAGAFVGAVVAGALYWFSPTSVAGQGWWAFSGEPRRYVDYLPIDVSGRRHVTFRFLAVALGGGVVAGLVLGALLAVTGIRLVRVSGSSPSG